MRQTLQRESPDFEEFEPILKTQFACHDASDLGIIESNRIEANWSACYSLGTCHASVLIWSVKEPYERALLPCRRALREISLRCKDICGRLMSRRRAGSIGIGQGCGGADPPPAHDNESDDKKDHGCDREGEGTAGCLSDRRT